MVEGKACVPRFHWPHLSAYKVLHHDLHCFPCVYCLICIAIILPTQTACVEQGFSRHRIVKNRLTNWLKIPSIDSLLRVGMLGPKVDMECKELVREAASLCGTPGNTGMLHRLFSAVNQVNLAAFDDDDEGEWDDDDGLLVYPGSEDEVSSSADEEEEEEEEGEAEEEWDEEGAEEHKLTIAEEAREQTCKAKFALLGL